MKLVEMSVRNFRSLERLELTLNPSLTVVIGRNGTGKTTILEVLAAASRQLRSIWARPNGRISYNNSSVVTPLDLRAGSTMGTITVQYSLETPAAPGQPEFFGINISQNSVDTNYNEFFNFFERNQDLLGDQPLFVYYRQDRGFDNHMAGLQENVREEVIDQSLDVRSVILNLETWWEARDSEEARQVRDRKDLEFRDPQLESVRNLVQEIDTFHSLRYSSVEPKGLWFKKVNGDEVPLGKLSSGERSYIMLLADLARRLQIMQPERKLGDIQGVVLIDEIELNLHPAWQSEIIPTLRRIFSSCQFVITTHSPLVISSVESDYVRILKPGEIGQIEVTVPDNTRGRSSNFLLDGVFEADSRLPVVDELIDQFNDAIDRADVPGASDLFDRLKSEIEGTPPEMLVWRKRLTKIGGRA